MPPHPPARDRPGPPAAGAPSVPLRVVVAVVAAEAALLVAAGVLGLTDVVTGQADVAGTAAAIAVVAALAGGALGVCARGLWRRQRWARGPVLSWQLLQLLVMVTTSFGDRWWVPAALVLAALVAGVGLLLPRVVAETTVAAEPPVV